MFLSFNCKYRNIVYNKSDQKLLQAAYYTIKESLRTKTSEYFKCSKNYCEKCRRL